MFFILIFITDAKKYRTNLMAVRYYLKFTVLYPIRES